jgi:3-oxoacyl-[acyl-carrier protein] reductase
MSGTQKVAIVTGAGTGVGAATAKWLARHGYDVVINYSRSAPAAEAVVAECREIGADAVAVQGDVGNDADCRRIADEAVKRWGRIHALVNSAGTTQFVSMANLDALNAEDFERVFRTNVIGVYQMARAVEPHMRKNTGAIVNVSSIGALTGNGSSYAYSASKAALNTLTLSLARNLAPEIRVNAVLPGMIEGRWLREGLGDDAYERMKAQWTSAAALGTVCTPEQIAATIGWLITQADVITGQLITVDAGTMLGKPPPVPAKPL